MTDEPDFGKVAVQIDQITRIEPRPSDPNRSIIHFGPKESTEVSYTLSNLVKILNDATLGKEPDEETC